MWVGCACFRFGAVDVAQRFVLTANYGCYCLNVAAIVCRCTGRLLTSCLDAFMCWCDVVSRIDIHPCTDARMRAAFAMAPLRPRSRSCQPSTRWTCPCGWRCHCRSATSSTPRCPLLTANGAGLAGRGGDGQAGLQGCWWPVLAAAGPEGHGALSAQLQRSARCDAPQVGIALYGSKVWPPTGTSSAGEGLNLLGAGPCPH